MKNRGKILLGHGSGGRLMHKLVKELLLKKLNNPILKELGDSAFIKYRDNLAFSTDSFVVSPLKFNGADIGKLSVCGTVNDLVMLGAVPEYLSLSLIIEEGFSYSSLEEIVNSIAATARKAKVFFVTGDIKVVEKGACDKIFINTSGIGRILKDKKLSVKYIEPGDKIIVTGPIARHGLAVLTKRKELDLGLNIKSDCAALNDLIIPVLKKTNGIKFMRDPTRGGLATTLNEISEAARLGIIIYEEAIPVDSKSRVACELLGIDPLYVANEGVAVIIVRNNAAKKVLSLLKKSPLGKASRIIGLVASQPKAQVVLNTKIGTWRIIDMLSWEPLPRIC